MNIHFFVPLNTVLNTFTTTTTTTTTPIPFFIIISSRKSLLLSILIHVSMNEIFYYYIATLTFVCVISALLLVYRYFLGNRLTAQANKLKSQIANIKQNFPELEQRRRDIVASGIGDIGIEGIMSELGIDPGILKNPLVKGLVDRYAPKIIEQLSKKQGEGATEQTQAKGFM